MDGDAELAVALERVEDGADPLWMIVAHETVRGLPTGEAFTTDRVWYHLDRTGISTPEPRALGAVIRALAAAGVIARTGEYVKTTRPQAHSRPIPVWKRT